MKFLRGLHLAALVSTKFGTRHKFLLLLSCATIVLAVFTVTPAQAQGSNELTVTPTAADRAAALQATHISHHATPAHTKHAWASRGSEVFTEHPASGAAATAASSAHELVRYPGDLSYQGGPVVEFAESHAIYMLPNGDCPISQCWGDPEGFLRDLSRSDLIELVDQYIGLRADGRYTVGSSAQVSFTPSSTPLTDADMIAVVHSVALATGQTGYAHVYHVFLPPGTDECLGPAFLFCYSPDNLSTFFFCAYHGSADTDIGHLLYSVEPYQNVPGCQDRPGTPNGQLVDSTNDSLSHELFETITDPDGTGWLNSLAAGLGGEEIGDECLFVVPSLFAPNFADPSVFKIGEKVYAVQLEYANSEHACSNKQ